MSGRGRGGMPAFSGRGGGRITSLQARDAAPGGRGGGRYGKKYKKTLNGNYMNSGKSETSASTEESNVKLQQTKLEDALEAELGFPLFSSGDDKLGWLMNIQPSSMEDKASGQTCSAADCYFMCQDGSMFKARMPFAPYFYLQVADGMEMEAEGALRKRFEGLVQAAEIVEREDLDLKNHLSGLKRKLLRVSFWNSQQLQEVKRELVPVVAKNKARAKTTQAYAEMAAMQAQGVGGAAVVQDVMEALQDMREFDVPYHIRFAIDLDIRCGHWFTVRCRDGVTSMERRADLLQRAEPRICAWDIETTKLPLQFPNADYDQVFMISYMLDRQGYLITNREVVGGDIANFEFTPKPEFEGPFIIFNEANEEALLRRFFNHMREAAPAIYVTYNGDFFDFPFVEKRAAQHGMDLAQELGFKTAAGGEVLARHAVHMDCLHWVNRDSYLPQGSRGLKAVTKAKLGYDPVEVDPEDMLRMAAEQPQAMAAYSVSDAVSTYYLYMTYIHPFIFSLATIIPMPPDDVLRKGSGTLCEQLLMVQAFLKGIVCPNKHAQEPEAFYKGHLLDSETYIGGKVEARESGVFRADLPLRFRCQPAAYQGLIDRLDKELAYVVVHEGKMRVEDLVNYQEVRDTIAGKLAGLRDTPNREEVPLLYHLDVAAMYPNIILTNRLQPSAIVTDEHCAACDFNRPGKTCLREMEWVWRGEHFAATRAEYMAIKNQLASETFPPAAPGTSSGWGGRGRGGWGRGGRGGGGGGARGFAGQEDEPGAVRYWEDLGWEEKAKLLKDRLKMYTQKVYKRVLDKPVLEPRVAGVCQRENDFYVDTVRAFRDRRYEYKGLNKTWKNKLDTAKAEANPLKVAEASDMCVLYESLQLAHKCILNSFYGYVMRKGARWYSMEMAGVVTNTGANIIQMACGLVEQLGRPLELDTDGIWCALPASFPENFKLKNKNGKELKISYPCVMLNVMVADHCTNEQYQTLVDPATKTYAVSSEMSIEFEVDGPYKAMILPASKEEGKSIKKRYAVFNFDGSLAELKGFEIKRRGELKLIKVFQAEVFEQFLAGTTLAECYAAVAAVANRWLDMLDTQGGNLTDEELVNHISEATTMSKGLEEYEGRKSCAITCARRLGSFLGDEQIRDKGLNCTYVIARKPENLPTSERAIPVSIFSAEPAVARNFLRKWCGSDLRADGANGMPDVRDVVDWAYYRERLSSAIQKIITIPAAMQAIPNPCPRVKHPDWLHKKVAAMNDKFQQRKLHDLLPRMAKKQSTVAAKAKAAADADMEDVDRAASAPQQLEQEDGVLLVRERPSKTGPRASDADVSVAVERSAAADAESGKDGKSSAPKADLGTNYVGWVVMQKNRWRQQRVERKRRKAEAAALAKARPGQPGDAAGAQTGHGSVGALLKQRALALTSVSWQVLQLSQTATPGRFKMWFLAEGRVHWVHLVLPRTLYLDSEQPLAPSTSPATLAAHPGSQEAAALPPGAELLRLLVGLGPDVSVQRVQNKQLPGGRRPVHLYQLTLPEPVYLAAVPMLETALAAPFVRGVYEERMPLVLSASLALGCVVKVTPSAAHHPLSADFHLSDFRSLNGAEELYLAAPAPAPGSGVECGGAKPLGPHLHYIALYSSMDAAQGRAVYCLFAPPVPGQGQGQGQPGAAAVGKGLLVVVQQAAAAKDVSPTALERPWREALVALGASAQGCPDKVDWSVEYVRDGLDAGRALQRALLAHKAELRGGGVMCAVQAHTSAAQLATTIIPLLADCPCVDLPSHADDSKYPALQWQTRAARRAVHRVAGIAGWLREHAALTRYAHVPLANMQGDSTVAVFDILMARTLQASEHLLWIKDPALPDLGVADKDDAEAQLSSLLAGTGANITAAAGPPPAAGSAASIAAAAKASAPSGPSPAALSLTNQGGVGSPEVLAPGAYRSVCVELRLHNLAVAALQQCSALSDLEGSGAADAAGGPAAAAFKALRSLVMAWLHDAQVNVNEIADNLLQSLYRWLSNPGSHLYDPALQRAVQGLMAKLFAQLVSEMRKLGAVIVSANFNTIRVATGKRNVAAAVGYTRYLLDALRRRELFGCLELSPSAWWHALLFRDPYNFGGIEAVVPQEMLDAAPSSLSVGQQQAGVTSAEEDMVELVEAPTVKYQWNVKQFLPPALQERLVVLLTEFIYLPWKEAAAQRRAGASQGGSQAVADAARAEDAATTFLLQAVPGYFTQKLLRIVTEVERVMPVGSERPEHQFPQLAGSHLSQEELGSPALAFVRTVCHLMGLDGRCTDGVSLMRRQLLRLLNVREFSLAAEFQEVCLAFTLPDVICSYCNDCRDLDLCRDDELAAQSPGQKGTGWACRHCGQHYSMPAIEKRLVSALQQHVREYELQDLQCIRCRSVSSGKARNCCGVCGGNVQCTLPSDVFWKRLTVFRGVAHHHGFPLLEELASWLLSKC